MRTLNELTDRSGGSVSAGKHIKKLKAFLSPPQLAFVEDLHRFKTAVAGRRGGKTAADAAYLTIECLKKKTATLYLGLTLDSAKGAIWDTLITMLDTLKIPYTKTASPLRVEFPNGSFIRVTGADMSNAAARLRGPAYSLIVIDECGFYSQVDELVYALLPTLADHAGTIALTSSPGILLSGLLYDAHEGKDKDKWHQFHWTLLDNPFFQTPATDSRYKTKGEQELATICDLKFGGDRDDPEFVREYLGRYEVSSKSLVYSIPPESVVSTYIAPKAQVGVGVAFGLAGKTSVVSMRYSEYSRTVCIETAESGVWTPDQLAEHVRAIKDPTYIVAYLGEFGKEVSDEFRRRYEIPISPTSMKSKTFFQDLLRGDLQAGLLQVKSGCPILNEWSQIVRDKHGVEVEGQESLMADAVLVLYGKLYNHHLKTWSPPPTDEQLMIQQLINEGLAEKAMEDELRSDWLDL